MESVLNRLTGYMNDNLSIMENSTAQNVDDLSLNELVNMNQNFNHIINILRNRRGAMDLIMNSSIQEENDNDLQMAIMASLNN